MIHIPSILIFLACKAPCTIILARIYCMSLFCMCRFSLDDYLYRAQVLQAGHSCKVIECFGKIAKIEKLDTEVAIEDVK